MASHPFELTELLLQKYAHFSEGDRLKLLADFYRIDCLYFDRPSAQMSMDSLKRLFKRLEMLDASPDSDADAKTVMAVAITRLKVCITKSYDNQFMPLLSK